MRRTPRCPNCGHATVSVSHVFSECAVFDAERLDMQQDLLVIGQQQTNCVRPDGTPVPPLMPPTASVQQQESPLAPWTGAQREQNVAHARSWRQLIAGARVPDTLLTTELFDKRVARAQNSETRTHLRIYQRLLDRSDNFIVTVVERTQQRFDDIAKLAAEARKRKAADKPCARSRPLKKPKTLKTGGGVGHGTMVS